MNYAKKHFLILLAILMFVVAIAGCNNKKAASAESSQDTVAKPLTYQRLQSVTIEDKDDGEIKNYSIVWNGEECTFIEPDDDNEVRAFFDDKTKVFYMGIVYEAEPTEFEALPVHQYDEYGRVIKFFDEDNINDEYEISYDKNGWPIFNWTEEEAKKIDLGENIVVNTEKMQVIVPTAGSAKSGGDGTQITTQAYDIRTLGDDGNIISVDEKTVTTKNDEKVSEEIKEDVKKYSYDKNGNIISYETKYEIITFTYFDETIHHMWERNIPIFYMSWHLMYDIPFYWNIK